MPLWGATDGTESKPKYLTDAEKKLVFANASGWVLEAGSEFSGNDNTEATPEVLVAIGELAESLGSADITQIEFITTAFDKSDGGSLTATVLFNEKVTVTGNPTLSVTNGNQGTGTGRGPHVLVYTSGSSTNKLTFTLAIGAANAATNADDVLSFGANALAHAGGSTIVDKAEGGNATITSAASIGTAAGTITVAA